MYIIANNDILLYIELSGQALHMIYCVHVDSTLKIM